MINITLVTLNMWQQGVSNVSRRTYLNFNGVSTKYQVNIIDFPSTEVEAALHYKVMFCCLFSLTVINSLTEKGFKYPERKTIYCWPEPASFNLIRTLLQKISSINSFPICCSLYTLLFLKYPPDKSSQALWIKLKSTSFRRGNKSRRYRSMSS